ncbi:PKD domain-containing protein [Algoriphagus pacificus]|uniref:PKD domain-containing protein n=1 Tax=Algoriphagus pacificus TaxID=2811234 RepID=UPI00293D9B86|nr:PKD domain-containing protein [Algoriphagus pacificus]
MKVELFAQSGFPYCETFDSNTTKSTTVFGADAQLVNGALRLTNNSVNQRGYVYIDIPFSSAYGIKTSFEYFSYGGDGADGLAFFLFDASVPNFAIGGFGGSLGYSKRVNEPGLAGAYLGVGFDEFGNFGNTAENKSGGFPGAGESLVPDAIVIRGPGNGFQGYEFIKGKKTMQSGPDGLASDQFFPISSGGLGTQRVTDLSQPGYRKANITLVPNPSGVGYLITLVMDYTVELNKHRTITIFQDVPLPYQAPPFLKIGFSASTGGFTNFHEIRNLKVEVANDDDLQNPIGEDISDWESCAGKDNSFFITNEEVQLLNENATIGCLQFYKTLDEIESISEDVCEQAECSDTNKYLVLPEGIFQVTDEPGGFVFTPNEEATGKEVTIYYTVTDNYGKRSQGNALTLRTVEAPEPMKIVRMDGSEISEIDLCGGESIELKGVSDASYSKIEWRKDGEIIEGATLATYTANQSGIYTLEAYNDKGCSATSNEVVVNFPEAPMFSLDEPIVGCEPGEAVDVTLYLEEFDVSSFDYLLTGMGISFLNEELTDVSVSGSYELKVKPKSLECYSNPIEVEVIILEEALIADFQFEVQGLGITGDQDGGIFPDDVIQFTNLSDESAFKWNWDFGDGKTSDEKNPSHVFGAKGTYEIQLSIANELGCIATITKQLLITKSYRLMFPTGFTPLEEENKTFIPKYKGLQSMELYVFNTWGELIFKTDDISSPGWDGTLDGKLLDAGVYAYRFNGIAIDGEKVVEAGKFRLIR